MAGRSEYDAAYFTLLRAREEHEQLLRFREYLVQERERLDAFVDELRDRAEQQPRRVRKPVDQTAKAVLEAVGTRRAVVLAELSRMDDRIAAAQRFVEECEAEVAELRG
jgi:BMFP domain-containing protein YqiC